MRPFFPRVGVLGLKRYPLHKEVGGGKPTGMHIYSWVILVEAAVPISPKWTELG